MGRVDETSWREPHHRWKDERGGCGGVALPPATPTATRGLARAFYQAYQAIQLYAGLLIIMVLVFS